MSPKAPVTWSAYRSDMSEYPAWKRSLIDALTGGDHDAGAEWNTRAAEAYNEAYSGRWFDLLADHEHPNEITARDLIAVTMLKVNVPAHTAAWILGPGRHEITGLLEQIPTDQPIWSVDEAELDTGSPASDLWCRLQEGCWPHDTDLNGIGWVKAGKLLASKRPQLIPIYDRKVKRYLGVPKRRFWLPLRDHLLAEEDRLAVSMAVRGAHSVQPEGFELSLLRKIDIVLWMRAGGYESSSLDPPPP